MAEKPQTQLQESRIPQDVMNKLLGFTIAILTLPLLTFFTLRWFGASAVWSGGSAAAVVHLLLAAFVYMAFTEKDPNNLFDKKKNE